MPNHCKYYWNTYSQLINDCWLCTNTLLSCTKSKQNLQNKHSLLTIYCIEQSLSCYQKVMKHAQVKKNNHLSQRNIFTKELCPDLRLPHCQSPNVNTLRWNLKEGLKDLWSLSDWFVTSHFMNILMLKIPLQKIFFSYPC